MEYYNIKIPNPKSQIAHALDISVGLNSTQLYSLDKKNVLIVTSAENIKIKTDEGVKIEDILPIGLVTRLTKKEAQALSRSAIFLKSDIDL